MAAILGVVALILDSSDDDDDTECFRDGLCNEASCVQIISLPNKEKEARHRQRHYIERIVNTFRMDEFKVFFRLSRTSVQYLYEFICEVCQEENIQGILERQDSGGVIQKPLRDRLLLLLWYMASLDKYASIADRFGMSESTACCAVRQLLQFIQIYLLEKVILWPSQHEQLEINHMYEDLKHFPGVVGFIDGTHISIRKPEERGFDYYNRKDYYSVVLQGVVREDLRFINVHTGWPGKVHDARVFRHSPLREIGPDLCGDGHLLGDGAYPNLAWLLTPFRDNGHLSPAQRRYNTTHASIRSTVERAFGLLKSRFTRLQHIDQRDIATIVSTVLTACILHNICILNHDDFAFILGDDNADVPQPGANVLNFNGNLQQEGAIKRLNITHRL